MEMNLVRAEVVAKAAVWPGSSAAAHCGMADPDPCLDMSMWRQAWSAVSWWKFLEQGESEAELPAIRRSTHGGRPLGPAEFTRALEDRTRRRLTPTRRGRPPKIPGERIPKDAILKM